MLIEYVIYPPIVSFKGTILNISFNAPSKDITINTMPEIAILFGMFLCKYWYIVDIKDDNTPITPVKIVTLCNDILGTPAIRINV